MCIILEISFERNHQYSRIKWKRKNIEYVKHKWELNAPNKLCKYWKFKYLYFTFYSTLSFLVVFAFVELNTWNSTEPNKKKKKHNSALSNWSKRITNAGIEHMSYWIANDKRIYTDLCSIHIWRHTIPNSYTIIYCTWICNIQPEFRKVAGIVVWILSFPQPNRYSCLDWYICYLAKTLTTWISGK